LAHILPQGVVGWLQFKGQSEILISLEDVTLLQVGLSSQVEGLKVHWFYVQKLVHELNGRFKLIDLDVAACTK
jgi:hypothetical protein